MSSAGAECKRDKWPPPAQCVLSAVFNHMFSAYDTLRFQHLIHKQHVLDTVLTLTATFHPAQ